MENQHLLYVLFLTCIVSTTVEGQCPANSITTCTHWQTCHNESAPVCTCLDDETDNNCAKAFTFTTDGKQQLFPYEEDSIVLNVTLNQTDVQNVSVVVHNRTHSSVGTVLKPSSDSIHTYTYMQRIELADEGSNITFIAKDEDNENITAGISFTIEHVYSTILIASSSLYQVVDGGDVQLTLTASTNFLWENISINVSKPDGSIESIPFNETGHEPVNITYFITNANLTTDLGDYVFEAIEGSVPADSPKTEAITVISIIISSDLPGNGSAYTTVREKKGNISCVVLGDTGNIEWLKSDAPVSTNEPELVHQESGEGGEMLLVFVQNVAYSNAGDYTCKFNDSLKKTLNINIEGKPEVTSLTRNVSQYSCKVEGLPLANIIWKIRDQEVNNTNGRFTITTNSSDENSYTVESTFQFVLSSLCLNNENLTCQSTNLHGTSTNEINVNDGDVIDISQKRYIVFPDVKSTYDDANTTCESRAGELVIVTDSRFQDDLTQLAAKNNIAEFYVGATKIVGEWLWSNNEPVDSEPTGSENDNQKTCSVLKQTDNTWTLTAVFCIPQRKYACQITAASYPKDMKIESNECSGNVLRIAWTPAERGLYQEIWWSGDSNTELKNLTNETTSYNLTSLSPETAYTIRITTIQNDLCVLHPYTLGSNTTSSLPPIDLTNPSMRLVDGGMCSITWNYPDTNNDVHQIYIEVTESVSVTHNNYPGPVSSTFIANSETMNYEVPTNPNSEYKVDLVMENYCGNSTDVIITGCVTELSEPYNSQVPDGEKTGFSGINVTLPAADNRNGLISCQFLVVRYMEESEANNATINNGISETEFLKIKQEGDDVENGNEFFALTRAGSRSNKSYTISLGDGVTKSNCVPLLATNERKRRDISPGAEIKALNRKLVIGARYKYYLVTTTPGRDGNSVFYGRSNYSDVYQISEAPSSSNVAVIVLSIFLVIIVIGIAFIFIRRRMSKGKKMLPNITFGIKRKAFHKEADYEVL